MVDSLFLKDEVSTEMGQLQFQYIAVFYNRSRRHSTLGDLSPTTFLQNWIERQGQREMAA